jgi:hypothetical protein
MAWNDPYRASKSLTYRHCHLPGYDQKEELCHEDRRAMTQTQLSQVENWNSFQQKTWYQQYLNKLEREECPIGVQGEFRTPGLAETKVSLMETGKWKALNSTMKGTQERSEKKDMNNSSNLLADDDFYAPGAAADLTHSYRPHSRGGGGGTRQMNPQLETKKNSFYETKTPPINPKTMFLAKNQAPIFGTIKSAGSPHSPIRPQTTNATSSRPSSRTTNQNNYFDSTNYSSSSRRGGGADGEGGRGTQNLDPISAAAMTAAAMDLSSSSRPMSSQALSRRHMGVSINPIKSKSGGGIASTSASYHSKINTLKESNRLNHLPLTESGGGTFILDRNSQPIHPQSGYDRGLKGTLLIDDWRNDELMKSDGKICYHPLSYDVLETLTYGPPDPAQKLSHDHNFVSDHD